MILSELRAGAFFTTNWSSGSTISVGSDIILYKITPTLQELGTFSSQFDVFPISASGIDEGKGRYGDVYFLRVVIPFKGQIGSEALTSSRVETTTLSLGKTNLSLYVSASIQSIIPVVPYFFSQVLRSKRVSETISRVDCISLDMLNIPSSVLSMRKSLQRYVSTITISDTVTPYTLFNDVFEIGNTMTQHAPKNDILAVGLMNACYILELIIKWYTDTRDRRVILSDDLYASVLMTGKTFKESVSTNECLSAILCDFWRIPSGDMYMHPWVKDEVSTIDFVSHFQMRRAYLTGMPNP